MHEEVTLMGIEYAGMRVKHLTYFNVNSNNELVSKIEKKKKREQNCHAQDMHVTMLIEM